MNESSLDLSLYLHAFPQIPTTRHIFLERNLFPRAGYILSKILPGAHWLFIADRTTWPLAGPA
ncbi:MAG: hypothetical protein OSB73_12405, partial [Candidatus Latescibacteria bacterium]|nr:hypothetical protein [Candidatus Latescibacterota bacterium]